MPELPEVETVKRGLNQMTLHQKIQGGDVLLDRTIAHPVSVEAFLAGLQGTTIAQWHRRGKYLLAELAESKGQENQTTDLQTPPFPHSPTPLLPPHLGVHLRMTGQLLWLNQSEPLQKHTRVRLFFAGDKELRFVDQRTFGQMWFVPPDRAPKTVMTGLQNLGPEPFSSDFSIGYFQQQLQRRRPIKNALLDQAIVAGVGNIYADEALFLSGVHPETLCADLTLTEITRLRDNVIQVLQTSIDAQGTTFSSFRSVAGTNGNYGNVAWVYGRDGLGCRNCETVIQRLKLAGRSAHFCPTCQGRREK